MQDCKRQGWLFSEERGNWQITDAGNEALGRVKPGVQITIFRTELGQAVAAIAREAAANVDPESIQALFTSPPFPLCSKIHNHGTMTPSAWPQWRPRRMGNRMPLLE